MTHKFKIGDRVILSNIDDKCEILTVIPPNRLNGKLDKPSYTIKILGSNFPIPGVYEHILKIDLEYYRNLKLEQLGINDESSL